LLSAGIFFVGTLIITYLQKPKIHDETQLPEKIASIYDVNFSNGMTSIQKNGMNEHPIFHDTDGDLFVYNGARSDFVDFKLNHDSKEIQIKKSVITANQRRKMTFQYIRIPKEDYSDIILNGNVKKSYLQ
jgi:hypothetical protein